MSNQSRSNVTFTNKQLIAGLQQYYGKKPVVLAGTQWPSTEIVSELQKEDALVASVAVARAAWREQVKALRAQTVANNKVRKQLHAAVLVNFGENESVLTTFGLASQQRTKPTVTTKATAAQKRSATRAARHVMGSKQRKALQAAPATQTSASGTSPTPATK